MSRSPAREYRQEFTSFYNKNYPGTQAPKARNKVAPGNHVAKRSMTPINQHRKKIEPEGEIYEFLNEWIRVRSSVAPSGLDSFAARSRGAALSLRYVLSPGYLIPRLRRSLNRTTAHLRRSIRRTLTFRLNYVRPRFPYHEGDS